MPKVADPLGVTRKVDPLGVHKASWKESDEMNKPKPLPQTPLWQPYAQRISAPQSTSSKTLLGQ